MAPPPWASIAVNLDLHAQKDALQIAVDGLVPVRLADLGQPAAASAAARVVEGVVEPAMLRHDALHQRLDRGGLRHVGRYPRRRAALAADLGGDRLARGLCAAGNDHRRARLGKGQRRCLADARSPARHEGDFAIHCVHCSFLDGFDIAVAVL